MKQNLLKKVHYRFYDLLQKTPFYSLCLKRGKVDNFKITPTDSWPGNVLEGALMLEKQSICYNHESLNLEDIKPSQIKEFAFVHGFDWLRDLRTTGDHNARRLARQLILKWIKKNKSWRAKSWSLNLTSQRLLNLIRLYDFFGGSADETFKQIFFKNLNKQLIFLQHNYWKIKNPLDQLKACLVLIFAHTSLPLNDLLLQSYLDDLDQLLPKMIDAPSFTIKEAIFLLRDLIDTQNILKLSYHIPTKTHIKTIEKLSTWIKFFKYSEKSFTKLGQACDVSSAMVDMLLNLHEPKASPRLTQVLNVEKLQVKDSVFLIDKNAHWEKLLSEGLPVLNFEWNYSGVQVILHSDWIMQDESGAFKTYDFKDLKEKIYRKSMHGHSYIKISYELPYAITLSRSLYNAANQHDIRGEDIVQCVDAGFGAIRFVLPRKSEVIFNGDQSGCLKMPSGETWQFLTQGFEEVFTQSIDIKNDTYPVLVMATTLVPKEEKTFKWSFFKNIPHSAS